MLSCARRLVAKLIRFMVVMSNTTLLIFTSASRLVDLLGGTLVSIINEILTDRVRTLQGLCKVLMTMLGHMVRTSATRL